jgi:DNA-binding LacI/PurR family transcriptional regulator
VPLTSVDQSSYRLGEEAAKLALNIRRAKKVVRPQSVLIAPKLVVRQSTVA